jgi:hypothetical protein
VWAKELRELLSATVNLLHIAHEFIPTIHAFHAMEDEDSSGTPWRPLCLPPPPLSSLFYGAMVSHSLAPDQK